MHEHWEYSIMLFPFIQTVRCIFYPIRIFIIFGLIFNEEKFYSPYNFSYSPYGRELKESHPQCRTER